MEHKMSGLHFSNRVFLSLLLTGSLLACSSSDNNDSEEVDNGVTNTAPIANAGNDQYVFIDSTVLLNGELSSDADGDEISYVWNIASLPSGSLVSLTDEASVNPTFTPDVVGSYMLELAVNDGELTSAVDSIEVFVSAVTASGTDGVLCDYDYNEFNDSPSVSYTSSAQWTCDDGMRELVANGIPDHEVGTFPNAGNPNSIEEQSISDSMTLSPNETSIATELGGPRGVTGYVLNGVKIDAGTAGSCDDSGNDCSLIDNSGSWSIEALGQTSFNFGTDDNNAHVQPGGTYHYHGMPEGFIEKQGGDSSKMTLIGWAADGFPIYARYGYTIASDASSGIKNITGSYQLVTEVSSSRPSTEVYALGTFAQDWQYVEGSGDLDQCNGRVGVTPEFPQGIYHYFATDTYPYFLRCVKGEVEAAAGGPPPIF
ncbi:YHYH protein [Paraglaciecola sp. L3A3]|uniref:YHYH protein n=1 Tax=Paraglaciecola sp. L3A3 TaxID=2686358 RepID=UPI001E4D66A5|nr:YHYH protein [Paraglaciecola sp. L3A3]